jgi:hypothetical protein
VNLLLSTVTREQWHGMPPEARVDLVRSVRTEWDGLELLDAPTRWEVIVAVHEPHAPGEAGRRLMEVEGELRAALSLPIEVYSPAAGDSSKLRQKLLKQRSQQVDDWLARRAETKRLGELG